jgi:hypothetical protein
MDRLHLVDLPGRDIPGASRVVVSVLAPSILFRQKNTRIIIIAFLRIDISSDRSKDHLNE